MEIEYEDEVEITCPHRNKVSKHTVAGIVDVEPPEREYGD